MFNLRVPTLGFAPHNTGIWDLSRDGSFRRGICNGSCLRPPEFFKKVFNRCYDQLYRDRYQRVGLWIEVQATYVVVVPTRAGVTGDNSDGTA